jgi:solute carrier family 25 S-adenosylmethionine transporter 26
LHEEGVRALFSGIGPRVIWISIGGSIFLGVYEKAKKTLCEYNILT